MASGSNVKNHLVMMKKQCELRANLHHSALFKQTFLKKQATTACAPHTTKHYFPSSAQPRQQFPSLNASGLALSLELESQHTGFHSSHIAKRRQADDLSRGPQPFHSAAKHSNPRRSQANVHELAEGCRGSSLMSDGMLRSKVKVTTPRGGVQSVTMATHSAPRSESPGGGQTDRHQGGNIRISEKGHVEELLGSCASGMNLEKKKAKYDTFDGRDLEARRAAGGGRPKTNEQKKGQRQGRKVAAGARKVGAKGWPRREETRDPQSATASPSSADGQELHLGSTSNRDRPRRNHRLVTSLMEGFSSTLQSTSRHLGASGTVATNESSVYSRVRPGAAHAPAMMS